MESLKLSLAKKLAECETVKNGWETLENEVKASAISVTQLKEIDNWHNNWVKTEFERRMTAFEKDPLLIRTKMKPVLRNEVIFANLAFHHL